MANRVDSVWLIQDRTEEFIEDFLYQLMQVINPTDQVNADFGGDRSLSSSCSSSFI